MNYLDFSLIINMDNNKNYIQRIANSGKKLIINSFGQCGRLIGWLGRHHDSDKFIIEITDLSSKESFNSSFQKEDVNGLPKEVVTSIQAKNALARGQKLLFEKIDRDFSRLNEIDLKNVIGIGLNVDITQDNAPVKNCYLEIRKYNIAKSYHLRTEFHDIELQNERISQAVLALLLCEVEDIDDEQQIVNFPEIHVKRSIREIHITDNGSILLPSMFINPPLRNVSIFSGSFNPFHIGHYEMYTESLSHPLLNNTPLLFELTTKNAAKQANNNINQRIKSIVTFFNKQQSIEDQESQLCSLLHQMQNHSIQILISNKGRFIQKQLHDGCFVIGADTYTRLFDLKYYNNDPEQLSRTVGKFVDDNIKLLVFNRKNPVTNQFQQITDYGVQYQVVEGWENDMSSTYIRQLKSMQ